MITLQFEVVGRRAFLVNRDRYDDAKRLFSFSAPGAYHAPQYKQWLKEKAEGKPPELRNGWDGKVSMLKDGACNVGLLLGARAEVEKAGYKLKIKWKDKPRVASQKGFSEDDKKYAYQNNCVSDMVAAIPQGGGLVLSATGSGKTKIAAQFASHISGTILFVVDQIDLLYQSAEEIQTWLKNEGYDDSVGVVGNGKFEPKRVTVATIQTLQLWRRKKYLTFKKWMTTIDVVIIDEIHVQMSRRNFSVVEAIKPQAVFGLTATLQLKRKPIRYKCYSICGPKLFEFSVKEGAEKGVLTKGVVVQAEVPGNNRARKYVKDKHGKMKPVGDYEHEVVYNKDLHKATAKLVKSALDKDCAVVVLVERIRHLKRIAKLLAKEEPKLCYGAIHKDDRRKTIKRFDQGKHSLIIANKVFTKGINIKRLDLIIDTAQRANRDDALQKFGRGVRLHSEKDGLIYISLITHGFGSKAGKAQRRAFKQAKIPLEMYPTLITDETSSSHLLDVAEALLKKTLKKPVQGKLFE